MRDKDKGKSEGEQIEGAAKNKSGGSINAPDLEAKDEVERPDGKIQEKAGKASWKSGAAYSRWSGSFG
jgi:uncharacterized protein YjbJ (UPF0337 family)